jgi:hypothetical protein
MSTLTTGGRLWSPHRHRHHPTPTQQPYLFGPASEIAEGSATNTAPSEVEGEQFLFWSVAGALSANGVQPPGQLTLSPVPIFAPGPAPGLETAWYIAPGIGNGRPGLIFDAFSETAGDWLDWDDTDDPFSVTPSAARGTAVDVDDDVAYTDGKDQVTVTAAASWPGNSLVVFDTWLVVDSGAAIGAASNELLPPPQSGGYAFAIYRDLTPTGPPSNPQFIPQSWRMGDPALLVEYLRRQSELTRNAMLVEISSTITDAATRLSVQETLLKQTIATAQKQLDNQAR